MGSVSQGRFVVKKDIFEECLVLFPIEEWERQNSIIRSKINPYNKEHNKFLRNFYRGSAEIILDSNNRMLIPKRLLDLANISKEAILTGQDGKIEIWSKELYDSAEEGYDDFAALAEKIMGGELNLENDK
jgi:MraZ protein